MKCRNQFMCYALATLALAMFANGSAKTEYSLKPSSEITYYHYLVPIGTQFDEVPVQQTFEYKPVHKQLARPKYASRRGDFASNYHKSQRHYSTDPFIPIAPPKEYTLFRLQQQLRQQRLKQKHQKTQVPQSEEIVTEHKQYAAPVLEQTSDFTLALTHQGYKLGPKTGVAVHERAGPRSSAAADEPAVKSLNVKLPLPLGLTPLNNDPLPLQTGASFDTLARGVTSYGTTHPLKV